VKIEIPFKAPTVNQMYATFNGRRVKSKEARIFKKEVEEIMKDQTYENMEGQLDVEVLVYSNWFNKDGKIKKKDVANYEKAIIDSVFANLEMDDSQIFEIKLYKIQSQIERSEVIIESIWG